MSERVKILLFMFKEVMIIPNKSTVEPQWLEHLWDQEN